MSVVKMTVPWKSADEGSIQAAGCVFGKVGGTRFSEQLSKNNSGASAVGRMIDRLKDSLSIIDLVAVPCSVFAMAVAAESLSGCPRVGVTLETEIIVIVVPGSVTTELTGPATMNVGIGSSHAIAVAMASALGTGRITGIMTGLAVLYILARRLTMLSSPTAERMLQRHAQLGYVAIVTESLAIVTGEAVGQFAFRLKTVCQGEIQIVNAPLRVVTAVAGDTALLIAVTTLAPVVIPIGGIGVLHFPIRRMNIGQCDPGFMAECAFIGRLDAVVTVHAVSHDGIVFG
jgi:hypothetical protein